MTKTNSIIIGVSIFIGLVINGVFLGRSLERFKKEDRSISVKGFSEREVKADLVVWSLIVTKSSNELSEGTNSIEEAKEKVAKFLLSHGITSNELIYHNAIINDKQSNLYENPNAKPTFRYLMTKRIEIRSNNVDNILKVSRLTDQLLTVGVVTQSAGLLFMYTKLNNIKPEMLNEAIKSAKNAALEFAKESNVQLGKLRKANQGYFSIVDRDQAQNAQEEGAYGNGTNDVNKKVRVVISADYSIE